MRKQQLHKFVVVLAMMVLPLGPATVTPTAWAQDSGPACGNSDCDGSGGGLLGEFLDPFATTCSVSYACTVARQCRDAYDQCLYNWSVKGIGTLFGCEANYGACCSDIDWSDCSVIVSLPDWWPLRGLMLATCKLG